MDELFLLLGMVVIFFIVLGLRWDILDTDRMREHDYGLWELNSVPMLRHNMEAYLFKRTNISMDDFVAFTQVSVHDQVRDGRVQDQEDPKNLLTIDNSTVFSRVQLRRYLRDYMGARICYSIIHPVYNGTMEQDTIRFYLSAKMAKDMIMLTGKQSFTYSEIEGYFEDKVFLNYLNSMFIESQR